MNRSNQTPMTDSKLYTILATFKKIPQNRLRKYVASPYFNVNEKILALFDVLAEHINAVKKKILTKEIVWQGVEGSITPFNDSRFRKHCSDLLRLVEDYLSQEIYEKKPLQKAGYLMEAVTELKLEKLINSTDRSADILTQQQSYRSAEFYYLQYYTQKNLYDMREEEDNRFDKSNVEEIISNLDKFYLAEKLRWYSTVLNRQNLISHDFKLLFVDEILEHLEKNTYDEVPPIVIYYLVYKTLSNDESDEDYNRLKIVLRENRNFLLPKEAEQNYYHLLNFCSRKLNRGNTHYLREYFEICKELLDKTELLILDGTIKTFLFRNLVTIALRLGEFTWTENFLKNFSKYLPESEKETLTAYNYSLLYIYQKKYDKAIPLLNTVDFKDIGMILNAKSALVTIYFDTDEDMALDSLLDSFKTFLHRHKEVTDTRRSHFLNFIKYVRKLMRLNPGDKTEIAKIYAEMEEDKKVGIASINWLYEKIKDLE